MANPHNEAARGYLFDLEKNRRPTAMVLPAEQEAVAGSIVRLDGRGSSDPEQAELIHKWAFVQVPIGSQVANDGFNSLETDSSIVSFAPDVTGHYKISLVVNDGSLDSEPAYAEIDTRVILIPNHRGLVPDASFIWRYLSDFWNKVEGRRKFDVFWSACIQILASEQLKLYQYDYNKSIRDIQKLLQRRWLSYEPYLDISGLKTSFVLADDQAGTGASTSLIDPITGQPSGVQPDYSNLVSIPSEEGNFATTGAGAIYAGRVLLTGGRAYTMGRTGQMYRAILYGSDGDTVPQLGEPNGAFHGSGFVPAHAGLKLKVSSGSLSGNTYTILEVRNSSLVVLEVTGPLPSENKLVYSVLPSTPDNAFFADRDGVVPTKQIEQSWRFSATLIADTDLESLGVSPGDIIETEVRRTDNNKFGVLQVQVVAVDRTHLGFVFNLEDLVLGVAAGGLSSSAQLALADALQVPTVSVSSSGQLVYTEQAAVISNLLRSIKFRRQYFEKALTSDTEINLGPFSVRLFPKTIIRNRHLPLADEIISVPVLQEYLKQPQTYTQEGKLYQATDKGPFELAREPYLLVENLDYIVDDERSIRGVCTVAQGSEQITIKYGDLIDRNVQPGDEIELSLGSTVPTFNVLQVVDPETVRVVPTPNTSAVGTTFQLNRKVGGRFLRFVGGLFGPKKPAPERLWAEISYFDNGAAIEGNFGVLVGLTREQLANQQGSVNYRSAVAGLMYALANGPVEANLELAGQILLGLPFAESYGVITEINKVYRRTLDGAPLYDRMLVEARDAGDQPTGITNIYFIPYGKQVETNPGVYLSASPEFSGLALNPDTGVEYQVGDKVSQFARLSKGIKVEHYLLDDNWFQQLVDQGSMSFLEKYHTFRFTANVDVVTPGDIDLAAQFFRRAKSSHVKLMASLQQVIPEFVTFADEIIFGYGKPPVFFDTPAFSLPMAAKFDVDTLGDNFFTFEGRIFSRYLSGVDLVSVPGADVVTSAAGGFINARPTYGEAHDVPFLRPGDVLEIQESSNAGRYPVKTVVDDSSIQLDLGSKVLDSQVNQVFLVYRPIENPFWEIDALGIIHDSDEATVVPGGFSAGIGVGDLVVFFDPADLTWVSKQYTILSYNPLTYAMKLYPAPTEATGTYHARFVRRGLLLRYLTAKLDYPYLVALTDPSHWAVFHPASPDLLGTALAQPGDQLTLSNGEVFTILLVEPEQLRVYLVPAPSTSALQEATISRPSRPTVMVAADILDRFPEEHLDLVLASATADLTTEADSDIVTTVSGTVFNDPNHTPWVSPDPWPDPATLVPPEDPDYFDDWPDRGHISNTNLNLLPGDEIELLSGADAGRHVVVGVPTSTSLRLAEPLTETHGAPGLSYKIWRKCPNEG